MRGSSALQFHNLSQRHRQRQHAQMQQQHLASANRNRPALSTGDIQNSNDDDTVNNNNNTKKKSSERARTMLRPDCQGGRLCPEDV